MYFWSALPTPWQAPFFTISNSNPSTIVGSTVTERLRIGMHLHERTSYLNSLIENSPLGIIILDKKGNVELRCNPSRVELKSFAALPAEAL
jgi:hypothetical protein